MIHFFNSVFTFFVFCFSVVCPLELFLLYVAGRRRGHWHRLSAMSGPGLLFPLLFEEVISSSGDDDEYPDAQEQAEHSSGYSPAHGVVILFIQRCGQLACFLKPVVCALYERERTRGEYKSSKEVKPVELVVSDDHNIICIIAIDISHNNSLRRVDKGSRKYVLLPRAELVLVPSKLNTRTLSICVIKI